MTRAEAAETLLFMQKDFDKKEYEALNLAIKVLEGWTPASEKPQKGKYLCTLDSHTEPFVIICDYTDNLYELDHKTFKNDKDVGGWYCRIDTKYFEIVNVVAWMPLPDPYIGESEE